MDNPILKTESTDTKKIYRSKCCNAKCFAIGGRFKIAMEVAHMVSVPKGQTMYSECARCKKPCDFI